MTSDLKTLGSEANPDDALLAERDYLLKSLDDLEREFANGSIDAVAYKKLRGDYTARAAETIREIRSGSLSPRRKSSWKFAVLVLAVAILCGWALSQALGSRVEGGQVMGAAVNQSGLGRLQKVLETDALEHPWEFESQIRLARFYESSNEPALAFKYFKLASKINPNDPESLAHAGWILVLSGQTDEGISELVRATGVDAAYVDAHFFLGFAYWRSLGDAQRARPELQRVLVLAPDSVVADNARSLLAELPLRD